MSKYKIENPINEFIDDEGKMVGSKMKKTNPKITSNITTDDAVTQSRQGMVWMNYRRFYGESAEIKEYNDVADACSKDPKSFWDFLENRGEEEKFEEYFTADESINEDEKKVNEIISDIVRKRTRGDIYDKKIRTIEEFSQDEPIIYDKINKLIDFIVNNTSNGEKKMLLDYLNEKIYG